MEQDPKQGSDAADGLEVAVAVPEEAGGNDEDGGECGDEGWAPHDMSRPAAAGLLPAPSGPFPLHKAAAAGDVEEVTALLPGAGTALDQGDRDGFTPLHWACRNGRYKVTPLACLASYCPLIALLGSIVLDN